MGTAVGAAIGAVAGGLAGKGIAELIDPTVEDRYWKDNYSSRDYVPAGASFNDYGPAYRYGYETFPSYYGKRFDDVESDLSRDWDRIKGTSRLTWNEAKYATKRLVPAYQRRDRAGGTGRFGSRRKISCSFLK